MPVEIKMPQLSDTMHSGKILAWRKNIGDKVNRGDVLAEVETDKANLEIEAFGQGTLLSIITPAQSTANVGEVIGYLGADGEQVPVAAAQTSAAAPAPASTPEVAAAPPSTPQPAAAPHANGTSERMKISPLARKIAEQNKIDLSTVRGSGPQGRIVRKDLESAAHQPSAYTAAAPVSRRETPEPVVMRSSIQPGGSDQGRLTPLSKMRDTIARRMQQSVNESPHFYSTVSINMREALRLREVLKGREEFKGISVNHFVIKASAYALAREPRVNGCMREGQLFEPASINIGIITAIEDGLMIPVVRAADQMPLRDLVFEARAAIERVRAGRPSSSDLLGGTFSISNMGMFEIENFTAIINPGQGAVLAVSAVSQQPIVENNQITIAPMMKVTLSVDHRIIDGIMAANFLKHFKQALEVPALLMV